MSALNPCGDDYIDLCEGYFLKSAAGTAMRAFEDTGDRQDDGRDDNEADKGGQGGGARGDEAPDVDRGRDDASSPPPPGSSRVLRVSGDLYFDDETSEVEVEAGTAESRDINKDAVAASPFYMAGAFRGFFSMKERPGRNTPLYEGMEVVEDKDSKPSAFASVSITSCAPCLFSRTTLTPTSTSYIVLALN